MTRTAIDGFRRTILGCSGQLLITSSFIPKSIDEFGGGRATQMLDWIGFSFVCQRLAGYDDVMIAKTG